jgi:hypothetical protein
MHQQIYKTLSTSPQSANILVTHGMCYRTYTLVTLKRKKVSRRLTKLHSTLHIWVPRNTSFVTSKFTNLPIMIDLAEFSSTRGTLCGTCMAVTYKLTGWNFICASSCQLTQDACSKYINKSHNTLITLASYTTLQFSQSRKQLWCLWLVWSSKVVALKTVECSSNLHTCEESWLSTDSSCCMFKVPTPHH